MLYDTNRFKNTCSKKCGRSGSQSTKIYGELSVIFIGNVAASDPSVFDTNLRYNCVNIHYATASLYV